MHCLSVWWAIDHNPEKGWAIRLPNALHLLHAMWQFIACIVGTRFIASAGMRRGSLSSLPFAHEVVQTKFFRRVIELRSLSMTINRVQWIFCSFSSMRIFLIGLLDTSAIHCHR